MPTAYEDSEFIKLRDLAHKLEVEVEVLKAQGAAAKEALQLANKALDAYKSANNEWRSALSDSQNRISQYMTTTTADARFDKETGQRGALADRVYALEKTKSEQSGKSAGIDKTWALIVTLAFLAVALFGMWMRGPSK
jgi:hypothetical protein